SDIGDWEAIHRALSHELKGDLHTSGSVIEYDCENTLLISNHRPIVAVGVNNLVVIETEDAILVMSKERSQDIKIALEQLLKSGAAPKEM
ncbi:MAG TPA: mannose-1-phosphate guanylyltransferase/mannose-6-phosphate isomerase, partial [Candidatus Paceibacterota bacterium]|nr:mannose-1-phosphate guanylyltransferase/mannose-6-phosphate isomerase [Candidatus Paceibacterota bacterium]